MIEISVLDVFTLSVGSFVIGCAIGACLVLFIIGRQLERGKGEVEELDMYEV